MGMSKRSGEVDRKGNFIDKKFAKKRRRARRRAHGRKQQGERYKLYAAQDYPL